MSQQPTDLPEEEQLHDTPTHRYDLMQMRVNQIQGMVTLLQSRRLLHIPKVTRIKADNKIANARTTDAKLSAVMNKLEKLIEKMKKDDGTITNLLNEARGLILDASDGQLVLEKTDGIHQGT